MKKNYFSLGLLMLVTILSVNAQSIIYVDANLTTGANDGSSWADAIRLGRVVQIGINTATNGDEIRIASGSITDDTQITVNKAVTITGGYDPGSDTRTGFTTLTGSSAARRLVINGNLTIDLNYLIIENGGTTGAGALIQTNASPTFNNVIFQNNAGTNGGAVSISAGAAPSFKNVVFSGNSSSGNGAAVFVDGTNSETISFTNVVFANNTSSSRAGGIDNLSSATLNLNSCTFYGNTAVNGSGMFLGSSSTAVINNTVFYGNLSGGNPQAFNAQDFTKISGSSNIASDAQAGTSISDNSSNYIALTADPFTDSSDVDGADNVLATADDGLFPAENGQLVGAGDNSLNSESEDITGAVRVNGTIDVGAYESSFLLSIDAVLENSKVTLFPNPASSELNVETAANISKIEIYSVLGKRVLSTSKSKSIDVSSLAPGVYISKITSDNGSVLSKRIVKN
ncbi:MAG: T9SS type A sorting domain-containing protein [Algibacter sp.]|uniref:T9SS type A sorting domain-containing protein n=1 Tax=Algibacter sp. TaxID=1872428 RepID=UPI00263017A0|nr:T9SS type A sorting domain-containing protein [Algibacter sp.]MDG1729329.1 T9SS type A sorting domain-containing protein [Algibacter sp.]MDG2179048.1 T9SS type A sorting domain-containing protein [Algibacter sp.]